MQITKIMTRDVQSISPDTTLQEAAQKMMTLDIGLLPVMEGARVVGVITDRDLIVRAIAAGRDPAKTHVREAMTKVVICCFEDQNTHEAAKQMNDNKIRRLPVLNRENKLVGIVSLADLSSQDAGLAGEVLKIISQPRVPA